MNATSEIVRIARQPTKVELSKAQKLFNRLIKKIDVERRAITEWQQTVLQYKQKYSAELMPKIQSLNELKSKLVALLDQSYDDKLFTKRDKSNLRDLICQLVGDLLSHNDEDEELKEIYSKYSDPEQEQEDDEAETMKLIMEDVFGIEADDDLSNPEEIMKRMAEKIEQDQAEREERQAHRKKSAKALEREAKEKVELQNISQSIREIYRKLASALHPDKERDQLERDRKTEIMMRVNIAYDNKDLLQLLELQLEIEQIDETAINTLSEDKLKYYNKILTEQVNKLTDELDNIKFALSMQFDIPHGLLESPHILDRHFASSIKDIKRATRSIKEDLSLFKDKRNLKQFLREFY